MDALEVGIMSRRVFSLQLFVVFFYLVLFVTYAFQGKNWFMCSNKHLHSLPFRDQYLCIYII